MGVPGMGIGDAEQVALRAVELSIRYMPRVTGASARGLSHIYGSEWFGVEWSSDSLGFQETGIRPFTMRNLAGKTVPMWVKDRDLKLRTANPKIKTRTREDTGETEVLIFRKAAEFGERKDVWRMVNGQMQQVSVPRSYPGAPGRIAVNRSQGKLRDADGRISRGNVGVRWRHPGLDPGRFLARGMLEAANEHGFPVQDIQYLPEDTLSTGESYSIIVTR